MFSQFFQENWSALFNPPPPPQKIKKKVKKSARVKQATRKTLAVWRWSSQISYPSARWPDHFCPFWVHYESADCFADHPWASRIRFHRTCQNGTCQTSARRIRHRAPSWHECPASSRWTGKTCAVWFRQRADGPVDFDCSHCPDGAPARGKVAGWGPAPRGRYWDSKRVVRVWGETASQLPVNQSINQPTNQSINRAINQSINEQIDQSINQSINQSSEQSPNQSIIQSIKRASNQSISR